MRFGAADVFHLRGATAFNSGAKYRAPSGSSLLDPTGGYLSVNYRGPVLALSFTGRF